MQSTVSFFFTALGAINSLTIIIALYIPVVVQPYEIVGLGRPLTYIHTYHKHYSVLSLFCCCRLKAEAGGGGGVRGSCNLQYHFFSQL